MHTNRTRKGKLEFHLNLFFYHIKIFLLFLISDFCFFRLELVTGALQKYRTIIRQRNIVQYDPVYPYISGYLDKVSKNLN